MGEMLSSKNSTILLTSLIAIIATAIAVKSTLDNKKLRSDNAELKNENSGLKEDKDKRCRINEQIRLSEGKVVDEINIGDIENSAYFCRCWKSSKWPYCKLTLTHSFIYLLTHPFTYSITLNYSLTLTYSLTR